MTGVDVAVTLPGMPILPHGMGSFQNMTGYSIDVPVAGRPYGYGEYMAHDGNIIGAGINLWQPTGAPPMEIYVCNYTTSARYQFGLTSGGSGFGSISHRAGLGLIGTAAGIGRLTLTAFTPVSFVQGEYIGIYVNGELSEGELGLDIAIEGTIYLNI
jgi:hypothetical protein